VPPAFLWPVPGRYGVSSGFLDQRGYGQHNAIDIPAPIGSPVLAAAHGRVAFTGAAGDCGLAVFIDHYDGWRSHYCHHNFLRVATGQAVAQGQRIGDVGATGAASGPHLHFNLFALAPPNVGPWAYVAWVGKYAVDPLRYLTKEDPMPDLAAVEARVTRLEKRLAYDAHVAVVVGRATSLGQAGKVDSAGKIIGEVRAALSALESALGAGSALP